MMQIFSPFTSCVATRGTMLNMTSGSMTKTTGRTTLRIICLNSFSIKNLMTIIIIPI